MKQTILLFALLGAAVTFAATSAANTKQMEKKTSEKPTPAERAAEAYRRTGGIVVQPNSAKGFVAVINTQKKVDAAVLKSAIAILDASIKFEFHFVSDATEAKGAGATIRIIDDPTRPPLLAAPEEHWSELNVARLADDLKTETSRAKFLPSRTRKMFLRAYAYAASAGGSAYPGNILDTTCVRDLDYCEEFIPMDAVDAIARHLRKLGLEHANIATYADACEEGWAPAPTNTVQKVIWDKVHALPKNPITIKPEVKKVMR